MMEEIGLTEDQLMVIINKGFESKKEKKLFEQLLLCEDFLRFKSLMLKRNKALESEAIKAMGTSGIRKTSKIEKERDLLRESQRMEEERKKKAELEEEEILRKVLEMSKKEAEEQEAIEKLEIQAAEAESKKQEEEERKKKKEESKENETTNQTQEEEEDLVITKKSAPKKLNPLRGKGELPPVKGFQKK